MNTNFCLALLFFLATSIIFIYSILDFPAVPESVLAKKLLDLTLGDIFPLMLYSLKLSILLPLFLYSMHLLLTYST